MKRALIIGSGTIGTAIGLHLSKQKYNVTITSRANIELSSIDSIREYFSKLSHPIDCLVNAAGCYGAIGKVGEISPEDWQRTIAINLVGVYACCHYALSRMASGGHIITLAGGGPNPIDHLSGYCSAKAGLARMVQTLALEYPDLRINLISPGPILSRMQMPLLSLGRGQGGSNYDTIRRIADTGEGAVPVENTLRVIDTILSINPTGRWYAARQFAEQPAAA